MSILLHIDTSGETASVAISKGEVLLAMEQNFQSNGHASFVQTAIQTLIKNTGISFNELDAISVTMGPGSYTGLRVGLSSAKGIAYAINKPLIGLSTLSLLADRALFHEQIIQGNHKIQIFSMIDAKRLEVFGAIYSTAKKVLLAEQPIILEASFFQEVLKNGPLLCVGNGVAKTKEMINDPHIYFGENSYTIQDIIKAALSKWQNKEFEDIAYSKPNYLKDFYQIPKKIS